MTGKVEFISEPIVPVRGTADATGMARGEPGLPARFTWRGQEYRVVALLRTWKSSGPCRHGSGEMYLRRHWYELRTDPPAVMTLYCDRQPRTGPKSRWWLYSMQHEE